MTVLTPEDEFSDIERYDIIDLVKGGSEGESNIPVQQLANRTEYLYNRMGKYIGITEAYSSRALTAEDDANKLIIAGGAANITLALDNVSTFKLGQTINIKVSSPVAAPGPYWVNVVAAQFIEDGSGFDRNNIWLTNGDYIELVAAGGWILTVKPLNYDKIGQDDLKRFQPRNSLIANGSTGTLPRSQYPRLWEIAAPLAINDVTWLSDPFYYRSMFSNGDGTTTFRLPDMRAMSWRGLDLGRGVSLGRAMEAPGGFEPDALLAHFHEFETDGDNQLDNNSSSGYPHGRQNTDGRRSKYKTTSVGGSENRIKNVGLIPVIYY